MVKSPRVEECNFLLHVLKKNVWSVENIKDKEDIKRLQICEEELILNIVIGEVEIFVLLLILTREIGENISQQS